MLSDIRFWLVILIPVTIGVILWLFSENKWRGQKYFNGTELVISSLVAIAIVSTGWYIAKNMAFYKNEQIGGFIDRKWTEDGDHQESDTDCTGTGEDRTCTTTYYTVYHRDFYLSNTTGDWWDGWIWSERVDKSCQVCEPYRIPSYWQNAYIGKPVSLDHQYKDYIGANLRKRYQNEFEAINIPDICPDYPYRKIDYDRTDKVLTLDFQSPELEGWNFAPRNEMSVYDFVQVKAGEFNLPVYLDTMFGYSGANYQADLMLIFANSTNIQYADKCLAKWERGPKNAIYVFFFGDLSNGQVSNVIVDFGVEGDHQNKDYSNEGKSNFRLKVKLESELREYFRNGGALDRETILLMIGKNIKENFNREEMSNYAELARTVKPSNSAMWFIAILVIVIDIFLKTYFYHNDL